MRFADKKAVQEMMIISCTAFFLCVIDASKCMKNVRIRKDSRQRFQYTVIIKADAQEKTSARKTGLFQMIHSQCNFFLRYSEIRLFDEVSEDN
ncbi:hypothetical protein, partial [Blautia massiliensis (ex Durand et al. 2017)]|uniref:hypothetical protein n=1 Tax=Blautia massiliensis (ex Durand et al. 2017) TaxID=1737424 RepID=UPI00242DCACC